MQRIILGLAGAISLLVIAAALFLTTTGRGDRPAPQAALAIDGAEIGGPFTLVDHTGATRASSEVIDGPTLIYFGYTWCPDVCPIDTQIMVEVTDALAEKGISATPIFITIDPARDDVASLSEWAEIWHPEMIAMTGSDAQISAAAKAYKAYYSRGPELEDGGYLMNHSAFMYLTDPSGLRAVYRRGYPPDQIADDIAWVLEG
ncbi:MAG: SCO family protein [Pseudomonadota bacterium]